MSSHTGFEIRLIKSISCQSFSLSRHSNLPGNDFEIIVRREKLLADAAPSTSRMSCGSEERIIGMGFPDVAGSKQTSLVLHDNATVAYCVGLLAGQMEGRRIVGVWGRTESTTSD
jgi:hypothetical protein